MTSIHEAIEQGIGVITEQHEVSKNEEKQKVQPVKKRKIKPVKRCSNCNNKLRKNKCVQSGCKLARSK